MVLRLRLTKKELEMMEVLWKSTSPMTIDEITEASPNRTWKDTSRHKMINRLIEKGAVTYTSLKDADTYDAKIFYEPKFTSEEYIELRFGKITREEKRAARKYAAAYHKGELKFFTLMYEAKQALKALDDLRNRGR